MPSFDVIHGPYLESMTGIMQESSYTVPIISFKTVSFANEKLNLANVISLSLRP